MLLMDLRGERFVKADHNRTLARRLNGRSHKSIEYRWMNISWALLQKGLPIIRGYPPGSGVSRDLLRVVDSFLEEQGSVLLERVADEVPSLPPEPLSMKMEGPPGLVLRTGGRGNNAPGAPVRVDFAAREARNRAIGDRAEQLVVGAERVRLQDAGVPHLARKVEWVSRTKGDGLGYDVLSFDEGGQERFIEVKGTRGGPQTPFYLSARELMKAQEAPEKYQVHRVHSLADAPRCFVLDGPTLLSWHREPVSYRVAPFQVG